MLDDQTDAELVKLARADDKDAFNLLLERYQLMAHCVALRLVANEETARELLQEAMLQAYLSLDRLRDETRFKNWFYGIVLNVCRNWRRQPRIAELPLDATAERWLIEITPTLSLFQDPQEILEEQELQQLVSEAVTLLTPKNRTVALLFYYECLPMQEIARQLNISLAAVKNRLLKAREQLRSQLKSSYPDMMYTTSRKRKGGTMLKMTLARVCALDNRDLVILQDEQRQRVLPLWLKKELQRHDILRMGSTPQSMANEQIEPLTIDLLTNLLQAMGGTIDKVSIEVLQDDLLYAQLYLRSQNGTQKIKARLNDALPLAIRTNSPLVVANEVLEQLGQRLADQPGDTTEQQLDDLWGSHPQDYERGIDNTAEHTTSGYLRSSVVDPRGNGILRQTIQAKAYTGKYISLSGKLKTAGVEQQASLYLQLDGAGINNVVEKQLERAGVWQTYSLTCYIPEGCHMLRFGVILYGKGTVWLEKMQLLEE